MNFQSEDFRIEQVAKIVNESDEDLRWQKEGWCGNLKKEDQGSSNFSTT